MEDHFLIVVIILIATAVFVVTIFKKLKLSPVLGYLVAGATLGDHGFKIVSLAHTKLLGELGVVFLLFAIGLELSMERLKAMQRYVFGLGSLQVIITSVVIAAILLFTAVKLESTIIIAGGLALSSTAIVMQVLTEGRNHASQVGRISLAILLLQDFVVVPLLVMVPVLAGRSEDTLHVAIIYSMLKAIFVLVAIFLSGRVLLRPMFSLILDVKGSSELPIAVTLLVVITASWITKHFGLSLALGAFVSGVLVAETDFRVIAEESISPFKGLLLGLFFMSVGIEINVHEIYDQIGTIATYCFILVLIKASIIYVLCVAFKLSKGVALHAGLLLSQGGEFSFILFDIGNDYGLLNDSTANLLLLVVTCSMAITPLLALIGRNLAEKIDLSVNRTELQIIEYGAKDLKNHVIIAGFGSIGRVVAKVFEIEYTNYVIVDINEDLVNNENVNGAPIFRGDITQISTLQALGADRASAVIMTINNIITVKKFVKVVRKHFEELEVILKIKEINRADELYDLGADSVIPQNQEIGLKLGCAALRSMGVNESEIIRLKEQLRTNQYDI